MQADDVEEVQELRTNLVPQQGATHDIFRAHGTATRWMHDSLVFFEITGPFNREFFQVCDENRRRVDPATAPQGPFANIVKVRGSLLMTPEALEVYAQYVRSVRAVATAHVVPADVAGRAVMVPLVARLYEAAGKPFAAFFDVPDAVRWAHDLLGDALAAR